ncbi:hypothetical protein K353_06112 [Kitasatospora sp. SolWspMP-SS2h]|nr:hypothetical protein K353_06112 [Kitasatospora sp. SolWspMP-SS2h]
MRAVRTPAGVAASAPHAMLPARRVARTSAGLGRPELRDAPARGPAALFASFHAIRLKIPRPRHGKPSLRTARSRGRSRLLPFTRSNGRLCLNFRVDPATELAAIGRSAGHRMRQPGYWLCGRRRAWSFARSGQPQPGTGIARTAAPGPEPDSEVTCARGPGAGSGPTRTTRGTRRVGPRPARPFRRCAAGTPVGPGRPEPRGASACGPATLSAARPGRRGATAGLWTGPALPTPPPPNDHHRTNGTKPAPDPNPDPSRSGSRRSRSTSRTRTRGPPWSHEASGGLEAARGRR